MISPDGERGTGAGPGVFGYGGPLAGGTASEPAAGVVGLAGDIILVVGQPAEQAQSYGGVFASASRGQIRLIPLPSTLSDPNGKVQGAAGDLLSTSSAAGNAALWFCVSTGNAWSAVWKQIV